MKSTLPTPTALLLLAVVGFFVMYATFLHITAFDASPFLLFFGAMFLLYPFRRESSFVRRLMTMMGVTFGLWLANELAALFIPFFVAFALAYMFEPVVRFLEARRIPRWVSALVFVLAVIGVGASIAIFVLPLIFAQLNDILRELSTILNKASDYLESKQFFRLLTTYGLNSPETRDLIKKEIVPRLEGALGAVFRTMLSFVSSLSGIVSQILNVILTPILTFYFLTDFEKLKASLKTALEGKNDKLLYDLRRINYIVRAYITGQAIAMLVIAIAASLLFLAFGIPYPFALGVVCGILNPIPYVGLAASVVTACITVVVVSYGDVILLQIGIVIGVVAGLHVVDNYVIQPRVVGSRVGMRPLALVAALFVFGHFFGIVGLVVAVPTTASLLMFVNDWLDQRERELHEQDNTLNTAEPSTDELST
jgi:predicted PurR-regulated permease PerM